MQSDAGIGPRLQFYLETYFVLIWTQLRYISEKLECKSI